MSDIDFSRQLVIPEETLFREIEGESVLLSLESDALFSLDPIGTHVWTVIASGGSIRDAEEKLLMDFDAGPEEIHRDIEALVRQLLEAGLVRYADTETPR